MEERIREIASRVLEWFSKGKNSPYECRISPTNKCNLACLPCLSRGRPSYHPKKELTKNDYLRIVKEAALLGVRRFDICGGGEPFCKKGLIEIMEGIKKGGMEGTVSTNGILITRKIAKRIVEMEWDEIRFSINGPNEKIDDYLRGVKGAFKASIKAIKMIVHYKEKFKREKPRIILTPIITSFNYDKVCGFVNLTVSLKVNSLILQPFMSEVLPGYELDEKVRRKISEKLKLNESQRKEFQTHLKNGKKLAKEFGLNTNFNSLTEESVKHDTAELISKESKKQKNKILAIPCYVPWWDLDISTEGEVGPCLRAEDRISIKEKKLVEIWNSDYFNSFRRMLVDGKIPEICKTCCVISTFDNQKCREYLTEIIQKQDLTLNS